MPFERVTGDEIIQGILSNMREGAEPLRYSVIVPGVFQVFLRREDHDRLSSIFPLIIREAKQALDEELARWNRRALREVLINRAKDVIRPVLSRVGLGADFLKVKEIKKPADGWQISIHWRSREEIEKYAQADDAPTAITFIVDSQLALPSKVKYGGGKMTEKHTRTIRIGSVSRKVEETYTEAEPVAEGLTSPRSASHVSGGRRDEDLHGTAAAASSRVRSTSPARHARESAVEDAPQTVYAYIRYEDAQGKHVFGMEKSHISVGRGGSGSRADLLLGTNTSVSREHLRIRFDQADGKFYLRDLSAYGTTLDGRRVPGDLQTTGGANRGAGAEVELPRRALIRLADEIDLDFEAVAPLQTGPARPLAITLKRDSYQT